MPRGRSRGGYFSRSPSRGSGTGHRYGSGNSGNNDDPSIDLDLDLDELKSAFLDMDDNVRNLVDRLHENLLQAGYPINTSAQVIALAVNIYQQSLDTPENRVEKIVKHNVAPTISLLGSTGPLLALTVSGAAVLGPVGIGVSGLSGLAIGATNLGVTSRNIDSLKDFHIRYVDLLDTIIRSFEGLEKFQLDCYKKLTEKDTDKLLSLVKKEDRAAVKNLFLLRNTAIDKVSKDISVITSKRVEAISDSLQEASMSTAAALTVASMTGVLAGGAATFFAGPGGLAIVGILGIDLLLTAVPKFDSFLASLTATLEEKFKRKDNPRYVKSLSIIGYSILTGIRGVILPIRFIAAMYNDPIGIFKSVWNAPNMPIWKKGILLPFAATAMALGLVGNVLIRVPARIMKSTVGAIGTTCFSIWSLGRAGVDKLLYHTGLKKHDDSMQRLLSIKDAWQGFAKTIKKDLWDRFANPIKQMKSPSKAFSYNEDKPQTGFFKFFKKEFSQKKSAPQSALQSKVSDQASAEYSLIELQLYIKKKEEEIANGKLKEDDKKLQLAHDILEITTSAGSNTNPLLALHQIEHNDRGLTAKEKAEKKPGVFSKIANSFKNFFGDTNDSRYILFGSWFGDSKLKEIFLARKAALFAQPPPNMQKNVIDVLTYKINSLKKDKKSDLSTNEYYKLRALVKIKNDLVKYKSGELSPKEIQKKIRIVEARLSGKGVQSSTLATSETATILDYARQFWRAEYKKVKENPPLAKKKVAPPTEDMLLLRKETGKEFSPLYKKKTEQTRKPISKKDAETSSKYKPTRHRR